MSLVVRGLLLVTTLFLACTAEARTLNLLVLGEAATGSCEGMRSTNGTAVYQMYETSAVVPRSEALSGMGCSAGKTWAKLGNALIQSGVADKVVFMPIMLPGARVGDWQSDGRAFRRLVEVAKIASSHKIHFDYALWQQGVSDRGTDPLFYSNSLRTLMKFVSVNFHLDKWLIAQTVEAGEDIMQTQLQLASSPVLNRFRGPVIGPDYDGVFSNTLDEGAAQRLAQLWLKAIRKADMDSVQYQRESLQYYFK